MTEKEFLESIDITGKTGMQTVTIPLETYNQLIEAHIKLQSIVRLYTNSSSFDFKDKVSNVLGLKEDDTDA